MGERNTRVHQNSYNEPIKPQDLGDLLGTAGDCFSAGRYPGQVAQGSLCKFWLMESSKKKKAQLIFTLRLALKK